MMRCITVGIVCWIGIAVWLSWGSLMGIIDPANHTYFALDVFLSFVYTLVPLVPSTVIGFLFRGQVWWIRGLLVGTTSCGIVIIFLMSTGQFDLVAPLVIAVAGFLIGISAKTRQQGSEQQEASRCAGL